MLVELAIGDAYGAGFEYAKPEFVLANNNLSDYVPHPKYGTLRKYTDDTQMTIANTEVILSGEVTRERLANAYVDCFKRDQREGYAGGFYHFLCQVKDGGELLAQIKPDSDKSGAAMRALPFGIYPDIAKLKELTTLQAAITHNTPSGINAAIAAALTSHYFLYKKGPKAKLGQWIDAQDVPGLWARKYDEPVGAKGWMAVRAAITALTSSDSLSEILRNAVAMTGDVDTSAALALGAASLSTEVKNDLPAFLYDKLENGTYGRDFLKAQNEKLMQKMKELNDVRT